MPKIIEVRLKKTGSKVGEFRLKKRPKIKIKVVPKRKPTRLPDIFFNRLANYGKRNSSRSV